MARRVGVDKAAVLAAALEIIDADGADALTLAAVADRLGIQAPSLYSHVDGLGGLKSDLAIAATSEFGDVLADAVMGLAGDDALRSFAAAYRSFATEHPGRYALTLQPAAGSPETRREAGGRGTRATAAVIQSYGLSKTDAARAGRTLRSALHGFATLETANGIGGSDIDGSFAYLVELVIHGIRTSAQPT